MIITIPKVYLNFQTSLAATMSSSATSFTLKTSTDDDGTTLSGTYLLTFDKGETVEEDMVVTLVGSAGTVVTRGLSQVDANTNVSGNQYAHDLGKAVEITSAPLLLLSRLLNGDDTFNGVNWNGITSIAGVSGTYVAPVNDEDYAMKKYIDDTFAGGTISINRTVISGNAGETVVAGQVVYQDPADQEWKLADASTAATSENVDLGVAQGAGTNGNPISGGVLILGRDTTVTGLTAGKVYLSDTAGAFSTTPGTIEVTLGIATSATSVNFSPRYDQQITEDQQDALVGTSGTPASGNLYATELGNQRAVENYAVDAAGSDTYAVTLDPVPAGYVAGMTIRVKFGTANIGAATINVNGLGAKAITKNGAVALQTGDILANQVAILVYDGTQFQLQSNSNSLLVNGGDADSLHTHKFSRSLASAGVTAISNDNTENTILTATLTGGLLGTIGGVVGDINFTGLNMTTGTFTIRLKYGATTVVSAVISTTFGSVNKLGYIHFNLIATGATNTQSGFITFTSAHAEANSLIDSATGTATEDSTGNLTFSVTVQFSSASANEAINIQSGIAHLIV